MQPPVETVWSISANYRRRHVQSTTGSWKLNEPVRAWSSRVQPLSGSRTHPSRTAQGPGPTVRRPSGPGPGRRPRHHRVRRRSASPTGACAPGCPRCSATKRDTPLPGQLQPDPAAVKGLIESLPGRNIYLLTPRATLRGLLHQTAQPAAAPLSPPTGRPHPCHCAKPCTPSTDISTTISTWPEPAQPETLCSKVEKPITKAGLGTPPPSSSQLSWVYDKAPSRRSTALKLRSMCWGSVHFGP